jgi:hypothetical protein
MFEPIKRLQILEYVSEYILNENLVIFATEESIFTQAPIH